MAVDNPFLNAAGLGKHRKRYGVHTLRNGKRLPAIWLLQWTVRGDFGVKPSRIRVFPLTRNPSSHWRLACPVLFVTGVIGWQQKRKAQRAVRCY